MEKGLTIIVLALIIGIQALHIGTTSRVLKYMNYQDDSQSKSYTDADAQTQQYYYNFGFIITISGLTILIYLALLITKLLSIAISPKVQEFLFYGVALLQFSYGVLIALTQSAYTDPKGPNGDVSGLSVIGIFVFIQVYMLTHITFPWRIR